MDSLIWGGAPTVPGWYGAPWDDERGIKAFDGPHESCRGRTGLGHAALPGVVTMYSSFFQFRNRLSH